MGMWVWVGYGWGLCRLMEMDGWELCVSLIPVMNVQFVIAKLKSISNALIK